MPNSNTGTVRSAELPSPNNARNLSIESVAGSEVESSSRLQEDTLHRRRNIPGKKNSAGGHDESGRLGDASTSTSPKAHGSISSALKIESADTPIDVKSSASEMNSRNIAEAIRLLSVWTTRAKQLREEQEIHLQRAQELQEQIRAGELACGRMTQQVLEAQEEIRSLTQKVLETREAIVIRKRHIKEDEEKLSQELRAKERKMEEVMSIVSRVNKITLETSTAISDGDGPHYTIWTDQTTRGA
ncbi:uncharacterized protein A1O5_13274 [Cladophialophora psammophila CBS 110553]|uniref:Uncharacterized protein n=1 Tax=Cladophialophora psammophila CBS 110553 TaxID=1182543 RepID=W9VDG3_9EURO|nr:uncharacterized protein A1O5_13274 [Cladophialophora psammophila CBS 110553]EXJ53498.1 hypothetical protein A1O5_13274 [Cladophialophora psammophila CBS 110553]